MDTQIYQVLTFKTRVIHIHYITTYGCSSNVFHDTVELTTKIPQAKHLDDTTQETLVSVTTATLSDLQLKL